MIKSKQKLTVYAPGCVTGWAGLEVVGPDDVTPMTHVVSVDVEEGVMTRYKSNGETLVTEGGALVTETVTGMFEVRPAK